MVEVIEETLVQEVMVKVKEEMVEEVMGATQETKEIVKNKTFLEAFHAFCDEENNDKSENEDTLGNDNHMSGGNLIYPILTSQNSHRRHKLFSPRHSTENNDFNISFDARTKNQKNTLKKGKRLKQSKNRKSKIKYTCGLNSLFNCGLTPSNFSDPINTFDLNNKSKIEKSKIETYPSYVSSTTMTNSTMPVSSTTILSSISVPKMSFYRNTMTNNDYNVLYDHNSDLYIPIAPILNVDMLLKK